jgi:hypothetical protein
MTKAAKPPSDMRAVVSMLMCKHQWTEPRNVRVIDPTGKNEPYYDGAHSICSSCGTNRIVKPDGTGHMYSPDALSDKHP